MGDAYGRITEGAARFREGMVNAWQGVVDAVAKAWNFIADIVGKVESAMDRIGRGANRAVGFIPGIGGGGAEETAASSLVAPSAPTPIATTAPFAIPQTVPVSRVSNNQTDAPVSVSFNVSANR